MWPFGLSRHFPFSHTYATEATAEPSQVWRKEDRRIFCSTKFNQEIQTYARKLVHLRLRAPPVSAIVGEKPPCSVFLLLLPFSPFWPGDLSIRSSEGGRERRKDSNAFLCFFCSGGFPFLLPTGKGKRIFSAEEGDCLVYSIGAVLKVAECLCVPTRTEGERFFPPDKPRTASYPRGRWKGWKSGSA